MSKVVQTPAREHEPFFGLGVLCVAADILRQKGD